MKEVQWLEARANLLAADAAGAEGASRYCPIFLFPAGFLCDLSALRRDCRR